MKKQCPIKNSGEKEIKFKNIKKQVGQLKLDVKGKKKIIFKREVFFF